MFKMVDHSDIERRVREIVGRHYLLDPSSLDTNDRFIEDLGSSLDVVEIFIACEEAFNLNIPDEELADITTLGRLVDLLSKKCGATTADSNNLPFELALNSNEVWPPPPEGM